MKTTITRKLVLAVMLGLGAASARLPASAALTAKISVPTDQPGIAVAPTLHGLFFEDINYGADGGHYAELVQNRSFEDHEPLYAWSEIASTGAEGRLTIAKAGDNGTEITLFVPGRIVYQTASFRRDN